MRKRQTEASIITGRMLSQMLQLTFRNEDFELALANGVGRAVLQQRILKRGLRIDRNLLAAALESLREAEGFAHGRQGTDATAEQLGVNRTSGGILLTAVGYIQTDRCLPGG